MNYVKDIEHKYVTEKLKKVDNVNKEIHEKLHLMRNDCKIKEEKMMTHNLLHVYNEMTQRSEGLSRKLFDSNNKHKIHFEPEEKEIQVLDEGSRQVENTLVGTDRKASCDCKIDQNSDDDKSLSGKVNDVDRGKEDAKTLGDIEKKD